MTTTPSSHTSEKRTVANRLYDEDAAEYVRHAETGLYNARYERPAMLDIIGDCSGLDVLDAGCAGGYYAAALSAKAKSVVAVDVSAAMIALVERKNLPNVRALVADLNEPLAPIDGASIDVIVASLFIHYLEDWTTLLSEFARVLRPGGRIVASTHHPHITAPLVDNYFEKQLVTDEWLVNGKEYAVRFYHRSLEQMLNEIVGAGLRVTRFHEPSYAPGPSPSEAERRLAWRPWFIIVEAKPH